MSAPLADRREESGWSSRGCRVLGGPASRRCPNGEGGLQAVKADEDVVGTSRVRELERRVSELERLPGRKTMEVEILKEALASAREKKPVWQLPSPPRGASR
jgi:hypothetical protein